MSDAELVIVFRSADESAEEDAKAIGELLTSEGIDAVVLDDNAPGVPEMAWEVRVRPADVARAEELIAEARLPDDELVEVDESPQLDSETVFSAPAGPTAEMEAISVKSLLDAAGIASFIVGDSVLPNLPFEVRVSKENAEQARKVIEDARAAGPQAAEEAERNTEIPSNP
ncbi:MAG TPA: DUF2007 domain-containing protein [Bryobacteraceae bacterium]|nr:DUF2007 domain-containing protein [Bryobacteraceae bacterium]